VPNRVLPVLQFKSYRRVGQTYLTGMDRKDLVISIRWNQFAETYSGSALCDERSFESMYVGASGDSKSRFAQARTIRPCGAEIWPAPSVM
jgi:hypothetical protein